MDEDNLSWFCLFTEPGINLLSEVCLDRSESRYSKRQRKYIPQFFSVDDNFSCCRFRDTWYSWEEKRVSISIMWSVLM